MTPRPNKGKEISMKSMVVWQDFSSQPIGRKQSYSHAHCRAATHAPGRRLCTFVLQFVEFGLAGLPHDLREPQQTYRSRAKCSSGRWSSQSKFILIWFASAQTDWEEESGVKSFCVKLDS
jgi:hypothetical protein